MALLGKTRYKKCALSQWVQRGPDLRMAQALSVTCAEFHAVHWNHLDILVSEEVRDRFLVSPDASISTLSPAHFSRTVSTRLELRINTLLYNTLPRP